MMGYGSRSMVVYDGLWESMTGSVWWAMGVNGDDSVMGHGVVYDELWESMTMVVYEGLWESMTGSVWWAMGVNDW